MKTTFINEMAQAFAKAYETVMGLLPENLIAVMSFDVFDDFGYIGINVYQREVQMGNAIFSKHSYIYDDETDKVKELFDAIIEGVKEIGTDREED